MYIKFLNSEAPLQCFVSVSGNVATLKFKDKIVVNTSGFHAYLDKNCEYDIGGNAYEKFNTVYRDDEETAKDNGYQLSSDGSVYRNPTPEVRFYVGAGGKLDGEEMQKVSDYNDLIIPGVIPQENYEFVGWNPEIPAEGEITSSVSFTAKMKYTPTLEEIKGTKKAEISAECEKVIHSGVDVNVSGQWEHFSLTTNDQLNLFRKQAQILAGETQFEYHRDGHAFRFYSLEEMQKIITGAMEHISYHTAYCNSLNMWISRSTKKEELDQIFYGADVPPEYQSEVLRTYLYNIENNLKLNS